MVRRWLQHRIIPTCGNYFESLGNPGHSAMTIEIPKESNELCDYLHISNENLQFQISIKFPGRPQEVPEASIMWPGLILVAAGWSILIEDDCNIGWLQHGSPMVATSHHSYLRQLP